MSDDSLNLHQQRLPGSTFDQVDLSKSRFHLLDLSGSTMNDADLRNLTIREVALDGSTIRGVWAQTLELDGEFESLRVNGIDVMPLVEAELVRTYPDYALMKPTDPAGFARAWDTVESLWAATVDRARQLPPDKLHESVGGEWSFIQTLRHLVFATECWICRAIQGEPAPWLPLSLPWDSMPPTEGVPWDKDARPSLDEVLKMRADRMAIVRHVIDNLTPEQLASETKPVEAAGWPGPRAYVVGDCLRTVLNEEWWHHRFAVRDLDRLT